MKTHKPALALVAMMFLANCATITRGSDDVLEIKTEPTGAQVQTRVVSRMWWKFSGGDLRVV